MFVWKIDVSYDIKIFQLIYVIVINVVHPWMFEMVLYPEIGLELNTCLTKGSWWLLLVVFKEYGYKKGKEIL